MLIVRNGLKNIRRRATRQQEKRYKGMHRVNLNQEGRVGSDLVDLDLEDLKGRVDVKGLQNATNSAETVLKFVINGA